MWHTMDYCSVVQIVILMRRVASFLVCKHCITRTSPVLSCVSCALTGLTCFHRALFGGSVSPLGVPVLVFDVGVRARCPTNSLGEWAGRAREQSSAVVAEYTCGRSAASSIEESPTPARRRPAVKRVNRSVAAPRFSTRVGSGEKRHLRCSRKNDEVSACRAHQSANIFFSHA